MTVTCVHIHVHPDHVENFIAATKINHRESVKEAGNLRFDVLRDTNDPARFLLYEVFKSNEAATAHKKTAHYLRWRDVVAPWMASPRAGVPYTVIAPLEEDSW